MKIPFGRNRAGKQQCLTALLAGVISIATPLCNAAPATASAGSEMNSDRLYSLTNIWTVHLKLAPEQWEAMEPKGGFNPFGGGPPGGGPGGRPGFLNDMGSRLLTPAIMSGADLNRDGRITREEFGALGEKWFREWDSAGTGKIDESQVRAGLDKLKGPGAGVGMMLQGREGKRNGIASALGIEFEYVHADLEFGDAQIKDVAVRYKGNGTFLESRQSLKRSFKVDLNKYAKGQSLGDVTMLTLQNNVTDASYMNEVLAYRLYRDAGVPAPRTAYARVFVSVPGKFDRKYFGLYSITEAVDKQFAKRHFGSKDGAIFKPVTPSLFADLGADWSAYKQTYDPKVTLDEAQKKAVMDLSRLVTQADDSEFSNRIGDYIDLPEFARFMAVMVCLSDLDGILGPGQNLYLHLHPKTHKFQFIPWDQDHSWGQFDRASQEQRDKLSINQPWQGENRFLERMFKLEAFRKLYTGSLQEITKQVFRPERIAQQVDEIATAIRPAVQEESESKLALFKKVVAGESIEGRGFGPFAAGKIKPIKPFTKVRAESLTGQLAGKSEGLTPGGGFPGGGGPPIGMMLSWSFLKAVDQNKDSSATLEEFKEGFGHLFDSWNTDKSGKLSLEQLRAGLEKDMPVVMDGFPPGAGGPPPGRGGPPGP